MQKLSSALTRIGAVIAAVLLWWLSTDVWSADNPILGSMSPGDAIDALGRQIIGGTLVDTVAVSLGRLLGGLLIATVIGVLLGLAIGSRKRIDEATSVIIQFLRMVSPLAWTPIAIVLFGIGSPPVVFLIAIAAVWPVTMNTVAGVRSLDPNWALLAKSLGATPIEILKTIVIPGIRPHVLTGIRLALGVAWIVIVPAEMLGVDSGLGYQILNARDQLDYALLAAIMLVIGVIGYSLDWLTQWGFKRWVAATA
jgi:NitT/TauT family transport system permease protein